MVNFRKMLTNLTKKKREKSVKKTDDNFVKNIVPNAKFGDIIVAKNSDKDVNSFDKDVLVVVGKTDNSLLCYYCETLPNDSMIILKEYKLFDNDRNISTPYKIVTIDGNSFFKNASKISFDDSDQLIMNLKYHFKENEDVFKKPNTQLLFNHAIRIRDIISVDDKNYLVLNSSSSVDKYTNDVYNVKFLLLPISGYDIANLDCDLFEYDKAIRISVRDKDLKYISSISRERYGIIVKKYYRYIYRKNELNIAKKKKGLKKGYIVLYEDKLYYVYNVDESNGYAFLISPTDTDFEQIAGNTRFIPHFDKQVSIDIKDDEYTFVDVAYSNEIIDINESRKDYFKNKIIREKKLNSGKDDYSYNVGDIVEHVDHLGSKFIVVGIYCDTLITIAFEPFIKYGEFVVNEFMFNDNCLYLSDKIDNQIKAIIKDNIGVFNSVCKNIKAKKRSLVRE